MHLIDHQILHGDLRKGLRAPVEVVLDHPGLIKHVFFLRHPPDALAGDCLCVNVQKDVLFIEKKALFLVIGPSSRYAYSKSLISRPNTIMEYTSPMR